jgi:hypothetical protein
LKRHRFVHETWLARIPRSGIVYHPEMSGFGHALELQRTRAGFRVSWASYDDGLDRLAKLLMPGMLAQYFRVPPGEAVPKAGA